MSVIFGSNSSYNYITGVVLWVGALLGNLKLYFSKLYLLKR